jgi:hypothetical protein
VSQLLNARAMHGACTLPRARARGLGRGSGARVQGRTRAGRASTRREVEAIVRVRAHGTDGVMTRTRGAATCKCARRALLG